MSSIGSKPGLSKPALGELLAALIHRGLAVRFRPGGQSMRPWLGDGDVVTIAPASRLRPGDVVLYLAADGSPVLHRLVRRRPGGRWQMRGDALWRLDDPVPEACILGRLVRLERAEDGEVTDLDRPGQRLLGRARAATLLVQSAWHYKLGRPRAALRRLAMPYMVR